MPQIYKVGGCVRDELLGIDSKDIDFTFVLEDVNMSVEDGFVSMYRWLSEEGYQIFLSTPEMFTIRAKFPNNHPHAGLVADFVMARKEIGYIEGTRRPVLAIGTLEDDLIRRDFTLNAMAVDEDGILIDPFNGKKDLYNRVLKTPKDPKITMMDDPLRILRAIRFAITKGFTIDITIWNSFEQNGILEKLRETVSTERIREELLKAFKHDTVKTIKMLVLVHEHHIPGFLDLIFDRGLWIKPTLEK
jgi:poly(A) polymerase